MQTIYRPMQSNQPAILKGNKQIILKFVRHHKFNANAYPSNWFDISRQHTIGSNHKVLHVFHYLHRCARYNCRGNCIDRSPSFLLSTLDPDTVDFRINQQILCDKNTKAFKKLFFLVEYDSHLRDTSKYRCRANWNSMHFPSSHGIWCSHIHRNLIGIKMKNLVFIQFFK